MFSNTSIKSQAEHLPVSKADSAEYVQYGCGLCSPANWTNFDVSPSLRLQRLPVIGRLARQDVKFPSNVRYGDIRVGLPIPKNSCAAVYCSHTLEHLAFDDARRAIRNTFNLLRPGGTFRFVLPDLEALARVYLASTEHRAASDFMASSYLGMKSRPVGLVGLIRQWLGNSSHLWMWDYKGIVPELEAAGFRKVRRAHFGDWSDPRFQDVEERSRWENCLGVECRRP